MDKFIPIQPQAGQSASAEAAHAERDVEVFAQLKNLGADLSRPRDARFYLYFPTEAHAQEAKAAVLKSSLKSEKNLSFEQSSAPSGEWLLLASADMIVDEKRIEALRKELIALAEMNGGEFDGWECAAKP